MKITERKQLCEAITQKLDAELRKLGPEELSDYFDDPAFDLAKEYLRIYGIPEIKTEEYIVSARVAQDSFDIDEAALENDAFDFEPSMKKFDREHALKKSIAGLLTAGAQMINNKSKKMKSIAKKVGIGLTAALAVGSVLGFSNSMLQRSKWIRQNGVIQTLNNELSKDITQAGIDVFPADDSYGRRGSTRDNVTTTLANILYKYGKKIGDNKLTKAEDLIPSLQLYDRYNFIKVKAVSDTTVEITTKNGTAEYSIPKLYAQVTRYAESIVERFLRTRVNG